MSITYKELSSSQKEALKLLKSGANCFISGEAGVGKTTLINYFLDNFCQGKNVLRCAPTGLAASNMKEGKTINSAFGFRPTPPTVKDKQWYPDNANIATVDIIIIDEISMCRIDIFDGIMRLIKASNLKREFWGYKPIQIILSGDFFQLPPVVTDGERDVLEHIYGKDEWGDAKIYCFESDMWKQMDLKSYYITKSQRQKEDESFVKLLNDIKFKRDVNKTLELIAGKTCKEFQEQENTVNLFASNKKVNKCNQKHLDELPGEEIVFKAELNEKLLKEIEDGKKTEEDLPVQKIIKLKPGARVIFTKNDSKQKRFQNGSFGEILEINPDSIKVKVFGKDETKFQIIDLDRNIKKYSFEEYDDPKWSVKEGKVLQDENPKTMWQIPMRLAYALTIHKSQGQTYESVNFDPKEDEMELQDGQLYTLLSRLKTINGLHIINKINPAQCKTSQKVLKFFRENCKE